MTRADLKRIHPAAYSHFEDVANIYSLWEEVLITFEGWDLPLDADEATVRQNLSDACYEWDF